MIQRFYQNVRNEFNDPIKVIDFQKIRNEGAHINVIMSERETQGKSTSAMEHLLDRWINHKEKGMLLLNKNKYFKENLTKLISANQMIYPQRWKGVRITEQGLWRAGTKFVVFVSLGQAYDYKVGTRDPSITTIIYDEFNVGLRLIHNRQSDLLESIIMSSRRNVRVFLLANKITFNVPILGRLGITNNNKELSVSGNDLMKMLVYIPRFDLTNYNKRQKIKDWRHGFSKQVGLYGMSVANKDTYDNSWNVVPFKKQEEFKQITSHQYIYFDYNEYGKLWQNANGKWFVEHCLDPNPANLRKVYTLKRTKANINVEYDPEVWLMFRQQIRINNVYFSNQVVKDLFISNMI